MTENHVTLVLIDDISLCDPNNVVFKYSNIDLPSRTKTLLAYG